MAAKWYEKKCGVDGCDRQYHSKGMCELHARRVRKFGSTELHRLNWVERAVEKTRFGNCWEFTGANVKGYGIINSEKESYLLHRLSYQSFVEPIKDGHQVCHKCDNPPCWNPAHLFQGTNYDNILDKMAKGRQAKVRGEASWAAKLTEREVTEIKQMIRSKAGSLRSIGRKFGVSHVQIVKIKQGVYWGHVA